MDILGLFDGLFSFLSASRAAREISDDAPRAEPVSSQKSAKQRREKQQQISLRQQEISSQRKHQARARIDQRDYSRNRER
ncbi:hypothetical protein [Pseudoalteromonas sp. Of7M-16]|uniref:hypothetical protein n=1 Tax=Pseudoalteromonas sp. Of7M-16 TaxID=2917756 RepID=UPI001EF73ED5|nr:hypothetical protein [Pseudoalteromonas sp. Of7M-16]MCG7549037.1 hypothetical protein [Pseudoalteromonas sp. Of7M-16]